MGTSIRFARYTDLHSSMESDRKLEDKQRECEENYNKTHLQCEKSQPTKSKIFWKGTFILMWLKINTFKQGNIMSFSSAHTQSFWILSIGVQHHQTLIWEGIYEL